MGKEYLIITFESTHMAMKIEKILVDLEIEMIPTPRHLSAACGISIKADVKLLERIKSKMGDHYGHLNQFYSVTVRDKEKTFKAI